jgi:hypothetical protein
MTSTRIEQREMASLRNSQTSYVTTLTTEMINDNLYLFIHKTYTNDQINNKETQDSVLGLGEDIHQVSKDLTRKRPNDP